MQMRKLLTLRDFQVQVCIVIIRIRGASVMFNAEVFTFIAILAVVIWDVAVVQAWDPGVGRGRGWGDLGVAIQVGEGEGWHLRPPN